MQKLFVLAACAALFVVGCNGKAAEKAGKAAKEAGGKTMEAGKEAGEKMMGKEGEEAKKEAGSANEGASLGTEGYTPVSLNLPKMSWSGCAGSVRAALVKAGASDIELDVDNKCGTCKVPGDMDVEAKLTELAADCSELGDFEIN